MSRRVIRIRADDCMAGDTIVIKEGRIRKFYHVCEVSTGWGGVEIIYNGPNNDFVKMRLRPTQAIRIREEY